MAMIVGAMMIGWPLSWLVLIGSIEANGVKRAADCSRAMGGTMGFCTADDRPPYFIPESTLISLVGWINEDPGTCR
jgi:hypothetical protein